MKAQEIKFKDLNCSYSVIIGSNIMSELPKELNFMSKNKEDCNNFR